MAKTAKPLIPKPQYLLTELVLVCAEVVHRASRGAMHPENAFDGARLSCEIDFVLAVVEIMQQDGLLPHRKNMQAMNQKMLDLRGKLIELYEL